MKKLFVLFIIFTLIGLPTWAEYEPVPKEPSKQYKKEIKTLLNEDCYKIINEFDNYESMSDNLLDEHIKTISNKDIEQYRIDMNNVLQHVLYDNITYNKKTLKQMLIDFDKRSTKIYKKYLKNKNDKKQNEIYLQKLEEMRGIISLYPDAIVEEFKNVIDKYDLNIVPGAECDTLVYKHYIKKYNIELAQEFKTLLIIKQIVYFKINNYILEVSHKI